MSKSAKKMSKSAKQAAASVIVIKGYDDWRDDQAAKKWAKIADNDR